ncbi:MAG: zonular occludens toxin domain-containing protein [Clostridia bacterium]
MYQITVFAGKTGSGKTMLATSKALKLIKKGFPVYSTYYIKGAFKLPYNFYDYNFPPDSTLIIDESQINLDSRNFKNLTSSGVSSRLKNKLSMHRHQKLDIWFITQQPEEIDAQIRRYCGKMFFCSNTIFKRKICIEDKRINLIILPYFQTFEVWPDINTYELYKKRSDPNLIPKDFGVKKMFSFITSKVFKKYNTYQQDVVSYNLKLIEDELHDNPDSLIDTKI